MNPVSDALDLLLQSFVQLAQRLDCVLKSPVRHFVRRYTFRQKTCACFEQVHPPRLFFFPANQSPQNLVMQGRNFHETLLLVDCAAPKLIHFAQHGLPSSRGIFAQQGGVFLFKGHWHAGLCSSSHLHLFTPVNRAAKTSASSLPLRYCPRILSAALCGFSSVVMLLAKSLCTPSVAK